MSDTGHKYDVEDSRLLDDDVGLTDHAVFRWQHRTPHDCPVTLQQAWQRGEDIQHPRVCKSDTEPAPSRVRLYRHSEEWGVAFIVNSDLSEFGASEVVVTVLTLGRFEHAPTAAYLREHEIHGPGGDDA